VVGVITFIINSRQENRQKQVEFLFSRTQSDLEKYYEAWGNIMFVQDWKSREEHLEKYPWSTNPKERIRFHFIGHYFNSIGLLLKEKVVSPDLFFDVFTPAHILTTWRRFEQPVKYMRTITNDPALWNGFEYIGNEAKKRYPEITLIPQAQVPTK